MSKRILEMITLFSMFKTEIIWFIKFDLNKIKLISITEVPKHLTKRICVQFDKTF